MATYIPDINTVKFPAREADVPFTNFCAMLNVNGYESLSWINDNPDITQDQVDGAVLAWTNARRNSEIFVNHTLKVYYFVDSSD